MRHPPLSLPGVISALEQYSFSDEAAHVILEEHPHLSIRYAQKIGDVWDAIKTDGALGMIPFENSSGGVVWPHLELLMHDEMSLEITASVRLQVRMCVGGTAGTTMENIHSVYSHSKGLEQSSKFLSRLPEATNKHVCSSTVEGVRKAAEAQIPGNIALASRTAIETAGLSLLAEDVADLPGVSNVTTFFVVQKNGKEKLPHLDNEYHAAIITPKNHTGVLALMLNQIAGCDMDLLSIHSRSVGDGEYAFFLEMERRGTPAEMGVLTQWLEASSFIKSVKWLGSWDDQLLSYAQPNAF